MDLPPLVSINITVPEGTSTHDEGHVLCVQGATKRMGLYITVFFLTNYLAHAATVKSSPGDKISVTIVNTILALFFPMSGLIRAVNAIMRFGRWGGRPIDNACRAGALCVVVRTMGWVPSDEVFDAIAVKETWEKGQIDEEIPMTLRSRAKALSSQSRAIGATLKVYRPSYASEKSRFWIYHDAIGARAYVDTRYTKIHGRFVLPPGYGFAILPRDTCLTETKAAGDDQEGTSGAAVQGSEIASSYSFAKAFAALVQAVAAFTILLGHRQDLISRWGYASFHLTVLPYLIMTVFNVFGNICTADFDCIYMVESPVMDEARRRKGVFTGSVGSVQTSSCKATEVSESELENWNGIQDRHIRKLVELLVSIVFLPPTIYYIFKSWRAGKGNPQRTISARSISLTAVLRTTEDQNDGISADGAQSQHLNHSSPKSSDGSPPGATEARSSRRGKAVTFHRPPVIIPGSHGDVRISFTSEDAAYPFDHPLMAMIRRILTNDRHTCGKHVHKSLLSLCHVDLFEAPLKHLESDDGTRYNTTIPLLTRDSKRLVLANFLGTTLDHWTSLIYDVRDAISEARSKRMQAGPSMHSVFPKSLAVCKISFKIILGPAWRIHAPCRLCQRESTQERSNTILYVPMCESFLRANAPREDATLQTAGTNAKTLSLRRRGSRYWTTSSCGVIAETSIGLLVIGIILLIIAWQSRWFSAGDSSPTQRTVMLLWICEGTLGMMFPLCTSGEIILVFLGLPYYVCMFFWTSAPILILGASNLAAAPIVIATVPVALFVAPIWGLVIVGQMLAEWGQCVTLF